MIRPATDKDVPDILGVIHQAFEQYRRTLDPPSGAHKETLDSVRDKLAHGGAAVATEGARVVGCCMWRREPTHLYVGRLAVLPEFRKVGIGGQLMEWMEQTARQLGAPRIQIMVRIALDGMKEFYERKGYAVTGQGSHEGWAVPTYIVMEKGVS
jgi:predicted N-acetyltransferase YhbS